MEYDVVPADLDRDRDEIYAVWKRNIGRALRTETLPWFYQNSPHGPGKIWLLVANPGGHVVGTIGVGLRRINVGGTTVMAGLATGLAVDKEHRLLLPALLLAKTGLGSLRDELAFVYTNPNTMASAVLQRAGYKTVGTIRRYVKVLRVDPYLRKLPILWTGTPLLAPILNLGLRVADLKPRPRKAGCVLREISSLDARFDALWERAASHYQVVGERTAELLQWRFNEYPYEAGTPAQEKVTVVGLLSEGEQSLLGYAAYYFRGKDAIIIDLFAEDLQETLCSVLHGLARWLRACGADKAELECFGPAALIESLRRTGFSCRKSVPPDRLIMASSGVGATPVPPTKSVSDWYFMTADTSSN